MTSKEWPVRLQDHRAPALSAMSAGVRLTISSRPYKSTAMWRLRRAIFLRVVPLVSAYEALTCKGLEGALAGPRSLLMQREILRARNDGDAVNVRT